VVQLPSPVAGTEHDLADDRGDQTGDGTAGIRRERSRRIPASLLDPSSYGATYSGVVTPMKRFDVPPVRLTAGIVQMP